jgi:hypothetical protein
LREVGRMVNVGRMKVREMKEDPGASCAGTKKYVEVRQGGGLAKCSEGFAHILYRHLLRKV